ncbi:MAG: sigma-70 family RNA polymerase sigma factor [Myxococcota bacterium]
MTDSTVASLAASNEEQREHFLALVASLRPRLHRYCAKMAGSALDGEDLVQDTLAHAFFRLSTLKDDASLEPWLFRIAHNRTIDWLRRKGAPGRLDAETVVASPGTDADTTQQVTDAIKTVVTRLPPKERACIVLKDVLGYPLTEISEIVDSTVGGVKAALHRGRSKLEAAPDTAPRSRPLRGDDERLVAAYVERFNRHDWEAVRDLLGKDARLELVGVKEIDGANAIAAGYFTNYARIPERWRLVLGVIDGERVVVHQRSTDGGEWRHHAALRIQWVDGKVACLRDYVHVDYLLEHADTQADPVL